MGYVRQSERCIVSLDVSYLCDLTKTHRSTRNRDWNVFYTTGRSWSADGTCSAGASAPLPSTASPRSTNIGTPTEATTSTGKASHIHHRRAHDCSNYIICPSVWSFTCHHFCEGNLGASLGLTHGKACP